MVQIDIRTFYKNTIKNSSIGNLKPDSYVRHCIEDPAETGLEYLKNSDNIYDIDLGGLYEGSTEERIKYLRDIKKVPNSIPDGKDISLVSILDNTIRSYYEIPDLDANTSPGCSKVDLSGMSVDDQDNLKFNTTNIKIKYDGKEYEIVHRDKIQILYNKIFDDPNKIALFFYVLLMSALVLFIYSILGVCFEFWLRYGNAKECIYYRTRCNSSKNAELNIIDYVFRSDICEYPYQICKNKLKQTGGLKGGTPKNSEKPGIKSRFSDYNSVSAKCINLDSSEPIFTGRAFPYNIADHAEDNFKNESIKSIARTISFSFLYVVLTTRFLINWILKYMSLKYQSIFKGNAIAANILFLFVSGLLFGLIAGLTKNPNVLFGAFWPLAAISFLITIGTTGVSLMLGIYYIYDFVSFLVYKSWHPEAYKDETDPGYLRFLPPMFKDKECDEFNLNNYYKFIDDKKMFVPNEWRGKKSWWEAIRKFIIWLVCNTLIAIIWLVLRLIILPFIIIVMLGLAAIYLNIVIPLKMFYIPLSNPLETFSLLKDHADLLTIFLCLCILSACRLAFNNMVTGIVAGLIIILIIMKVTKGLSSAGL